MAPYTVNVSPEDARELARKGATILILDVPPGTAIGMDHQVSGLRGGGRGQYSRAGAVPNLDGSARAMCRSSCRAPTSRGSK